MEMLKLGKLSLKNFGIFRDVKLDFSDKDVVGILAEYEKDKTRSNRSGKSLILEAIRYSLIGTTRTKKVADMIHHGEDHMEVKAKFISTDGQTYTIRRGVDKKGKGVLELDWIEKTGEAQEEIERLFGVQKSTFEFESFFKQSDIHGFMELGAAEKSKYLMQAMDISHWQTKYDLVSDDIKKYSNKLRDNEAVKKALEETLEDSEDLEIVERDLNEKLQTATEDKERIVQKLKKITKQLSDKKAKKMSLIKDKKSLVTSIEAAEKSQENIKTWKSRISELNEQNKKYKSKLVELPNRDKLVERKTKLENEKSELQRKIVELRKNKGGLCPILKESCDRIKITPEQIQGMKEESDKKHSEVMEIRDQLDEHDMNDEVKESIEANESKIKVIEERISNHKAVKSLKQEKEELEALTLAIEKISTDSEQDTIDEYEELIAESEAKVGSIQQKLGGITQRKEHAQKALEQIDEVVAENKKYKTILSDLKFIASMFSKNGIAANEIENSFSVIEEECNMLLKELDYGPTIVFSPDKEIGKWEAICGCGFHFPKGYRKGHCEECGAERQKQRKEEISLKIYENDVEQEFKLDSGGGKLIISFVVRLALTMYKRRQNKCKLNMLFLDEIDSALDSHLATSITNAIAKVLTKRLGFEQVFMISHKEEIKHSVPHILKVLRKETHSTAAFI